MTDQSHLDQDVASIEDALGTFNSTVASGFQTLSNQIAALKQGNPALDFTGLDQAVAAVEGGLSAAASDLASAVSASAPPAPPSGPQGATGAQGPQGATGAGGATGAQGPTGA